MLYFLSTTKDIPKFFLFFIKISQKLRTNVSIWTFSKAAWSWFCCVWSYKKSSRRRPFPAELLQQANSTYFSKMTVTFELKMRLRCPSEFRVSLTCGMYSILWLEEQSQTTWLGGFVKHGDKKHQLSVWLNDGGVFRAVPGFVQVC